MKILALDLSTNTGAAIGRAGEQPLLLSERFGEPGDHQSALFAHCLHWINKTIIDHSPRQIVIEEPIASGVVGKKERIFLAAGLRGCVMGVARMKRIPVTEYPVQKVRKHFLGEARVKRDKAKSMTIERCNLLGWDARNDNEADAAALWDYTMMRKGFPSNGHDLFTGV